ncbi:hypothetical protein [Rhodococcus jostii]|uniref:Uncharacterized protein n=1 Tax=Rhodococcus jostii TaxID=132919 RepID=A0A1H4TTW4_RHOJO|nr:hypothetical protein [Rhodococcus jostii]SEC59935.1 hypothetical protein SAMN04490220_2068 [Rhodococcus jostii]
MTSTHLHQNTSHTSIASWKRLATAAVATAAFGIIPAGAVATAATPVAAHDIPRNQDNTMPQQRQHDRQRDHRRDRRAETTIGNQILAGGYSSTEM